MSLNPRLAMTVCCCSTLDQKASILCRLQMVGFCSSRRSSLSTISLSLSRWWYATEDGHLLDELLVRESVHNGYLFELVTAMCKPDVRTGCARPAEPEAVDASGRYSVR